MTIALINKCALFAQNVQERHLDASHLILRSYGGVYGQSGFLCAILRRHFGPKCAMGICPVKKTFQHLFYIHNRFQFKPR